jgi:hypothetical protein
MGVEWCIQRHVAQGLIGVMVVDAFVLVRRHQQLACDAYEAVHS